MCLSCVVFSVHLCRPEFPSGFDFLCLEELPVSIFLFLLKILITFVCQKCFSCCFHVRKVFSLDIKLQFDYFFFCGSNMSIYCVLAWVFSDEKSVVNLYIDPFYVMSLISLTESLLFGNLMCFCVVFFVWYYLYFTKLLESLEYTHVSCIK